MGSPNHRQTWTSNIFLKKKAFNPCKNEVSAKAAAAVKPPLEEEATPLKAKGGKGAGGGGGRHRETFFTGLFS